MTQQILLDLYRYEGEKCKKIATQLRYLLFVPGFQYTYLFRQTCKASCKLTKFIWSALLRLCMYYTNIQIPVGTQIGEGYHILITMFDRRYGNAQTGVKVKRETAARMRLFQKRIWWFFFLRHWGYHITDWTTLTLKTMNASVKSQYIKTVEYN